MMSNNTSSYMSGRMSSRGGRGRGGTFGTRDRFNERTNHTFSKKTEEREQVLSKSRTNYTGS
jgi:hypothetical protein